MAAALSYWDSSSSSSSKNHLLLPWCARRPPRPPPLRRSVRCESRGVPWKKVIDPNAGLNAEGPGGRVARWDDSGAVRVLRDARTRYWAEINGGIRLPRGVPPLPDPGMYCDVIVDDDGGTGFEEEEDAEVEAEYEAAMRDMQRAREDSARLRAAKLRDDFVPVPTGWNDV